MYFGNLRSPASSALPLPALQPRVLPGTQHGEAFK